MRAAAAGNRPDVAASEAVFDAILTPNRSLSRIGFLLVMGIVCALSLGMGGYFLAIGAWPIFGFFGLDIFLLYVALKANQRAGRAHEIVRLSRDVLLVKRISMRGRSTEWRFNPYWVRVELAEPVEHDTPLILASHGVQLAIGHFLAPEERLDFARALRRALATARAPALTADQLKPSTSVIE